MNVKILNQPDSAIAHISLNTGEELMTQAGTMIAMSGNINVSTILQQGKGGGLLQGVKRLLAGESLFLSTFRAFNENSEIFLAPELLGDIIIYEMIGSRLIVQATSYLACSRDIDINVGFQGFKSIFSGESIFWLELSGIGTLLLTSFGGIYEINVDGEYIVDTGHIVAFEDSLNFEINKGGDSWLGSFLGGEGLVCRFQGTGKLYCQTHRPNTFGSLVGSKLPAKS